MVWYIENNFSKGKIVFDIFLLKVNFKWWRHCWLKNDVTTLDWWRHSQNGISKRYERRISITWNENNDYRLQLPLQPNFSCIYSSKNHVSTRNDLSWLRNWLRNLDRGVKVSSNFQKTSKNKLCSLKNWSSEKSRQVTGPPQFFHNK